MDVVRLPIVFKGLGRSLLLHEEDAFELYTLTIPEFELVTETNINWSAAVHEMPIQRGTQLTQQQHSSLNDHPQEHGFRIHRRLSTGGYTGACQRPIGMPLRLHRAT